MVIVCMEKSSCDVSTSSSPKIRLNSTSTEIYSSNQTDCNDINNVQEERIFWSKEEQSLLFAALAYGGVTSQIAIGWLSDKYGKTKMQMICGYVLLGVLSLVSPTVISSTSVPYYVTARFIQGAVICFGLSSVLPLMNRWITVREQGLMLSLSFSGYGLGNALTYPLSALLCEHGGWPSIFYFSGAATLSWCLAAFFLIYDAPATHPRIGTIEKQYFLTATRTQTTRKRKTIIPWFKIVSSIPLWSAILSYFFYFAARLGFVIYLPLYLSEAVGLSVSQNGIFSALPATMSFAVQLISGPIFDATRTKKFFSDTILRKLWHFVGTIVPATLLLCVSQFDPAEDKYLVIGLLTLGYAISEVAITGGFVYCLLDLAPDFVGILYGICNTALSAQGFVVPLAVSAIVPTGTPQEWNYVLVLFGCLYLSTAFIFVLFGSSELQSWGKLKVESISRQGESLIMAT